MRNKIRNLTLSVAILSVFVVANAQPKNISPSSNVSPQVVLSENTKSLCRASEGYIEENLKSIAYENISGIGDNSAPRETNRQLKINAAGNQITNQLIHMQSLQCPAIQWSITHTVFTSYAIECSLAVTRNEDYKEKCNRKNWTRTPPKSE